MTCKDCIHCRVCITYQFAKSIDKEVSECDEFQNKADFVEVVRCRDCKQWTRIGYDDIFECDFGTCKNPYDYTEKETYEKDYCSDGERKEGRSDE